MTKSINTVFYQLAIQVGPPAVAQAASSLGIPEKLLTNPDTGIALGDTVVHPGDMASAYATLADNGIRHPLHLITKVVTADGRVLYELGPNAGERLVSAEVARNVTEPMRAVARGSLIPLADHRPVAAKTGTTQNRVAGQNNDAWTVGYTPTLSTAVWVGTDHNTPIKTTAGTPIYGRMTAGAIWRKFMDSALAGTPVQQFPPFVPIGTPAADHANSEGAYAGDSENDGADEDNNDGYARSDHHHYHHHDGARDGDGDPQLACEFWRYGGLGDPVPPPRRPAAMIWT
jgi:membrane peptidoglycan carboxypeptidase